MRKALAGQDRRERDLLIPIDRERTDMITPIRPQDSVHSGESPAPAPEVQRGASFDDRSSRRPAPPGMPGRLQCRNRRDPASESEKKEALVHVMVDAAAVAWENRKTIRHDCTSAVLEGKTADTTVRQDDHQRATTKSSSDRDVMRDIRGAPLLPAMTQAGAYAAGRRQARDNDIDTTGHDSHILASKTGVMHKAAAMAQFWKARFLTAVDKHFKR
jgi:hypothetical protein